MKKSPSLCLLALLAAYVALWVLVPKATFLTWALGRIAAGIPHSHGIAAVALGVAGLALLSAPTVAFMAVQIAVVYFLVRVRLSAWQMALMPLLCLGLIAGLTALINQGWARKLGHYPNIKETFTILSIDHGLLKMLISLLIIGAAAGIGALVAIRVKDRNLLLPVVMFAAFVDLWTVTRGPVAAMLSRAPDVVNAVSAPIPKAGTGAFSVMTMIGPGDFLFMGLVFAAIYRLNMRGARNFWFIFVAMTIGMLVVLFGVLPYLPALIALAVAVVAANWRDIKLTRQEAISVALVAVFLAALLLLVWAVLSPKKVTNKPPAARPSHSTPRRATH